MHSTISALNFIMLYLAIRYDILAWQDISEHMCYFYGQSFYVYKIVFFLLNQPRY